MLINDDEQYVRASFTNEAEIEGVVQRFAEQLFGSSIIYLPQARIQTLGGRGTVPDAIVIDAERREWYVVEAERGIHGTWEHIAPQVSRQLAAVASPHTREAILQLALQQIRQDTALREMFRDIDVAELAIHGHLDEILRKPPTIAIPIDGIPKDLRDWIVTLRNTVKLWVLEKYVSVADSSRVLYRLPDDSQPTLVTTQSPTGGIAAVRTGSSQPLEELIDANPNLLGQTITLEYGPRGGKRQTFAGVLRRDGVEVDGKMYSLSYGAVECMRKAGSSRKTANGWTMWKSLSGETLDLLYSRLQADVAKKDEETVGD